MTSCRQTLEKYIQSCDGTVSLSQIHKDLIRDCANADQTDASTCKWNANASVCAVNSEVHPDNSPDVTAYCSAIKADSLCDNARRFTQATVEDGDGNMHKARISLNRKKKDGHLFQSLKFTDIKGVRDVTDWLKVMESGDWHPPFPQKKACAATDYVFHDIADNVCHKHEEFDQTDKIPMSWC